MDCGIRQKLRKVARMAHVFKSKLSMRSKSKVSNSYNCHRYENAHEERKASTIGGSSDTSFLSLLSDIEEENGLTVWSKIASMCTGEKMRDMSPIRRRRRRRSRSETLENRVKHRGFLTICSLSQWRTSGHHDVHGLGTVIHNTPYSLFKPISMRQTDSSADSKLEDCSIPSRVMSKGSKISHAALSCITGGRTSDSYDFFGPRGSADTFENFMDDEIPPWYTPRRVENWVGMKNREPGCCISTAQNTVTVVS